jgi:hypothetical protein
MSEKFLRSFAIAPPLRLLREGGSPPAIVEADDDGLYVVKFREAEHGLKSPIAKLVPGEIGRWIGLPVPEIAFVELDSVLACSEPDPEIEDSINASAGLNLGLDCVPGSITYGASLYFHHAPEYFVALGRQAFGRSGWR